MMLKVIQTANALSDERTQFLIKDRLSFMRFLDLGLSERVPGCAHDLAVPGTTAEGQRDQSLVRALGYNAPWRTRSSIPA